MSATFHEPHSAAGILPAVQTSVPAGKMPAARWLLALLVGTATFALETIFLPASAAEAPGTNQSAERYLIIVDTSFSMHRRAANVQKVVGDLLLSGMKGQLRPGDTIGVWTFNEELNAGSFPLQIWTPRTRQRIAAGVVGFLQSQRFEKRSQLDKALAPMLGVVKDSDKITVLLISDGEDKLSPGSLPGFDGKINLEYKLNSSAQRNLRMPFVTVLRARKGEFLGYKVSVPPWPVEFPNFPAEPLLPEQPIAQATPKPEAPKREPAPPIVPSLIVVGKKPGAPATAPTNAAAAAKPETTPVPPPTPPVAVPKADPSPATKNAPETNSIVRSPEPPVPSPTQPAESPPITISTTTQQVTVVPNAPAKSETLPLPKTETISSPGSPTVFAPHPSKSQPASATSPKPAKAAASTNVATAVAPVAPTPVQPPPATSPPVAAAKSKPTAPAPDPTPVVQTAAATPAETVFNRTGILIAGTVLLSVALGLVYVFMRRSRPPAPASLITRSMDRDKK